MVEVDYFTDASIVTQHQSTTTMGAYGYVCLSKDFIIKDSYVAYSIPNINYLECRAIYDCLLRIRNIAKKDVKYTIFTDSTTSCEALKKILNNKGTIKDNTFYQQVKATTILISTMVNENIDIHIIDIKSHCKNPAELKAYLNKTNPGFNRAYRKLIFRGNGLVDSLVNNTARFTKAYSSLPHIK